MTVDTRGSQVYRCEICGDEKAYSQGGLCSTCLNVTSSLTRFLSYPAGVAYVRRKLEEKNVEARRLESGA